MKWLIRNITAVFDSSIIGAIVAQYILIPLSGAFLFALFTRTHYEPAIMLVHYTVSFFALYAIVGILYLLYSVTKNLFY